MNENVVVKTKNSKGLIALVVILIIIVLGLSGFIVYDKFIGNQKDDKIEEKEETVKDITNSSLAKELEESIKTDTRGLYYNDKISSTDYNNEYLIMFGIKKYLLENNITDYKNMISGSEISDETTYKISKKTISDYMNKKFNTSGSYDLPLTKSVSDTYDFEDVIDLVSLENEWGLTSFATSGSKDYLYSELVKAEQIGNNIYIYDKMIAIWTWSALNGVSYTLDNTIYDDYECSSSADFQSDDTPLCPVLLNESNMDNYDELLSSELFKQLNDKLNTFKHTFKKGSDGKFYWVSSEIYE